MLEGNIASNTFPGMTGLGYISQVRPQVLQVSIECSFYILSLSEALLNNRRQNAFLHQIKEYL